MKNNRAALRYAKAALSISLDQGTAPALEQDMVEVVDVCNASEDLIVFLDNPVLSNETKKETIFKLFSSLSEGSKRLVDLISNQQPNQFIGSSCRAIY